MAKVRVCYEEIEEIIEAESFGEALQIFLDRHEDIKDASAITTTIVGSFYDRNR